MAINLSSTPPLSAVAHADRTPGLSSGAVSQRRSRITGALLFCWWLAFIIPVITVERIEDNLIAAGATAREGSGYNQLLVLVFAGLGVGIAAFSSHTFILRQRVGALLALLPYCTWSLITILWSVDPALSMRRLGAFVLIVVGCWGIGIYHYGVLEDGMATLAKDVIFTALAAALILAIIRLTTTSTAEILDPEWSLKSTTHVSYFAYHFGSALLGASVMLSSKLKRYSSVALFATLLLLLKGRTVLIAIFCCYAFAAALGARGTIRRVWGSLTAFTALVLLDLTTGGRGLLYLISTGMDVIEEWLPWVAIGGGIENLLNLSGREPLWDRLLTILADSPLIGSGFGGFWTTSRVSEIHAAAGWPAVNAHNGFLDEMLATGVVGLTLFLGFWGSYFLNSARPIKSDRHNSILLMTWLAVFLCFNTMDSIMQSFAQLPTFIALTAIFTFTAQRSTDPEVSFKT
jgi:O-antigen ligase